MFGYNIWDHGMHLITQPSQNIPPCHFSLLEPGIPDWESALMFSKCKLPDVGNNIKGDSCDCVAFPVLLLWHHRLCIWALRSVMRYFAIAALLWTFVMWSWCQAFFMEMVLIFQNNPSHCAVTCFFLWLLISPHSSSSPMFFHDLCMLT